MQFVEYRPEDYLAELCARQMEPALHIERERLNAAILSVGGAKGISGSDEHVSPNNRILDKPD